MRNAKTKPNILLIEQDEGMRNLLEIVLEKYDVIQVASILHGFTWIFNGNFPDLIILDVNTFDTSSALFEGVKSNFFLKNVPMVLLIGEDDFNKIDYYYAWNIKATLTKPFAPNQLQKALDVLFD